MIFYAFDVKFGAFMYMQVMTCPFLDFTCKFTYPFKLSFVSLLIIKNLNFVGEDNPHIFILDDVPSYNEGIIILGFNSPAKIAIILP